MGKQMKVEGKKETKLEGSITVFLTLVLLLIMALIGTVLEVGRSNVATQICRRNLSASMDSVLTEYYLPLYEDYHLFFLERGIDTDTLEEKELLKTMKEYMRTSFSSNEVTLLGKTIKVSATNFYGIELKDIKIKEKKRVTWQGGKLFLKEAVDYMKYQTLGEGVKDFCKKLNLLSRTETMAQVLEKKLNTEESFGQLGQSIMDIMEETEGIDFAKDGIKHTRQGEILVNKTFAKQFCKGNVTMNQVGVFHKEVFRSLQGKYVVVDVILEKIKKALSKLEQLNEELEEKEKMKQEQGQQKKQEGEEREKEEMKESLKEDIEKVNQKIRKKEKEIRKDWALVLQTVKGVKKRTQNAIAFIPKLQKGQQEVEKDLQNYKRELQEKRSQLPSSMYKSLQEDYKDMESYVSMSKDEDGKLSMISKIIHMKPILESNQRAMEALEKSFNISLDMKQENLWKLNNAVSNGVDAIKTFQVKDLVFDYGSLKINENVKNPMDTCNALNIGILNLVVKDSSKISKKKLSKNTSSLYEEYESSFHDTKKEDPNFKNIIGAQDIGQVTSAIGDLSMMQGTGKKFSKNADEFIKQLLFNKYVMEHFKSYISTTDKRMKKPTKLEYEQEYLLTGKRSDKENLQGVVNRILFIRTIMNFMYLLTDTQKRETTYLTAAALVGFTGLEPLVRLTQIMILITWSFEEAIVDTAAILDGKSIPLLKEKKTFLITYPEMFLFGKQLILKKIKQIKSDTLLGLGYEEFLQIFLLMEKESVKSYHAMDLIQENIRLRNGNNFSMKRCIFGLEAEATVVMPTKFITLPGVSFLLKQKVKGWQWKVIQEKSY